MTSSSVRWRHLAALLALSLALAAAPARGLPDAGSGAEAPEEAAEAGPPGPAAGGEGADAGQPAAPDPGEAWDEDEDWLLADEYADPAERDPLEPTNRAVFGFNELMYQWILDPVTDTYQFLTPRAVRRSLGRFFDNLGEPATLVNELLQLNPKRAGITSARFVVNTTVGVAGLFDPATRIGLDGNDTDFGETLGVYGIGAGWYLVVPVMGPSTVRDLVGSVVDGMLHPQMYLLATPQVLLLAGGGGLSEYDAQQPQLEAMRAASVDFYAAMRSAYLMHREAGISHARATSLAWGSDGDAEEVSVERETDGALQEPSSEVPASASAIFSSTAAVSAEKPSRLSTAEYSERRSASSETVPER